MRSYISEPEFWGGPIEEIVLREYQVESVRRLRENIKKGVNSQILASMVGSGKTVMGAYLLHECWQKGRKGMFVVDRISLLNQTSAVFDRYGIAHGVIQSGHPRCRPGELIQVASVQTLARRGWPDAELIIVDEAHVLHTAHKTRINKGGAKIIGLTATPFTRGLGKFFSAIVNVTTGNKLTAEGYLVPFKVWAAKEPDMTGAKVVAGEWTDEEASKRATKIIGDVTAEYLDKGEGRKTIAFGVDVAHCEQLQREFLRAGINAQLYTYLTGDEEREMMLREFRKPDSNIRILISVAALSRGFDVPDVGCIIMCRPLKASFAEFIQIIGRGLRSHPGKRDCYILDLAGNFLRHYPAMVEFFEEGAQVLDDGKPKPKAPSVPAEKKPRKCPRCKYVFGAGSYCPACGYVFPPKASIEHEAGSLAAFDGSKVLKYDRAAKERIFGELRTICAQKHFKPGWAAWTYKRIVGKWPMGLSGVENLPPTPETLALVAKLSRKPATAILAQASKGQGILELDLFA